MVSTSNWKEDPTYFVAMWYIIEGVHVIRNQAIRNNYIPGSQFWLKSTETNATIAANINVMPINYYFVYESTCPVIKTWSESSVDSRKNLQKDRKQQESIYQSILWSDITVIWAQFFPAWEKTSALIFNAKVSCASVKNVGLTAFWDRRTIPLLQTPLYPILGTS